MRTSTSVRRLTLAGVLTGSVVVGLVNPLGMSPALALTTHTVTSPNGQISFTVANENDGSINYRVTAGSQTIFETSPLGITTNAADFTAGMSFVGETRSNINTTYSLPAGTKPSYIDNANVLTLTYSRNSRTMQLVIRAYNDGVAYRYVVPGSGSATISDERSGFRLPAGSGGWAMDWRNDYEGDYPYRSAAGLNTGSFGMPVLASIDNNAYFALMTEGSVLNSGGSYYASRLAGSGAGDGLLLFAKTSQQTTSVATTYPFQTPWRAAVIVNNLGALANSNMVQNLNPPTTMTDTSWIKPGRAAWSWWSDEPSAADIDKQKAYVDFAASMGFEYVTVDCCWNAADIPAIAQYAAARNVRIFIWTDAAAVGTPALADSKFALWKSWGVAGVKIDFFQDDSQAGTNLYDVTASAAATHQLMVNFHGSSKPSGEERTWPNIVTSEGIRGTEHYKPQYGPSPTAANNVTVPFTRNVVGGMDYTPTVFSADTPTMTQGHSLAQAIVFTSAMINYADSAAAYEQWPGRHLMRALPTVWDETRLLEGFPGSSVTFARRRGSDWYVGSLTDAPRTTTVPLNFLGAGTHTATIFSDNSSGTMIVSTQSVTSSTSLTLPLLSHGGASVHISQTALPRIGDADNRYEAEAAASTRIGASVDGCQGCSGGSKVGNIGFANTLQINGVQAATAGTHRIKLYYASADARTLQVSVNGGTDVSVNLRSTGGWNIVGSDFVDVPLVAGSNTIRLRNTSGYAPDVDSISTTRLYEAEASANSWTGGAGPTGCGNCSGGSLVGNVGIGGTLTINGVGAVSAGNKTVAIQYVSGDARTAFISVNGGAATAVSFPSTGSWSTAGTKTVGLILQSGVNAITISNSGGYAPDFDRISVTN